MAVLIARGDIVRAARSWVGVPYRHLGRSRTGIDCIGLIQAVADDVGIPGILPPRNYLRRPSGARLVAWCVDFLVKAPTDELVPGSITVLYGSGRVPQHFAIVGDSSFTTTMIHAFPKRGVVVEHGWDRFWLPRIAAVYDYPVQLIAPTGAPGG